MVPLRAMGADSPYERFWGQLVRWLAGADTKIRQASPSVVMRLDRQYVRLGEPVGIRAAVRDEAGKTPKLASVSCRIQRQDAQEQAQTMSLSYDPGSGLFEGQFIPRSQGRLLLKVFGAGTPPGGLGEDEMSLVVAPRSAETERLARDDALLRQIAERTGGSFAAISALPDMVDRIIERGTSPAGAAAQPSIRRLYNFPALFAVSAVLMTLEWTLRRRWQLR
jgi:hypothetical protein